jgi:hypothetical protein
MKTEIREHIRAAIFEVTQEDNLTLENVQTLIKEFAGGIGFVFGAMQASANKTIPPELINNSVDEIAEYIKEVATTVSNFQPPKSN